MTVNQGFADEVGYAYSGGYAELVDALLEYVPDLLWPYSVKTFAKMRVDPQIGSSLKAYTLPIRRAQWAIDGAGCNPKNTQECADQLGLPILGKPPSKSSARRSKIVWGQHLRLALLSLPFGHMAFERTYDIGPGGRARIATLEERMPQSISQIKLTARGDLDAIIQKSPNTLQAETPPIGRDALVWYAHEKEGSAWTGRSLIRAAYAPWLIKHELWRVHATSARRFGMGVPSVEAPQGATPQQVLEAQRLASSVRVGDQSGAGLPPGFKLLLTGVTGSLPDTLAFIRYLDEQIVKNTLTGLLDLGTTATGSRALGDTFLDLFMLALQAIADDIAEQATEQLIVPLINLNWGEDEPAPRIVCADVRSDQEVTADTLKLLLDSGALGTDPALEEYVRTRWKLPERSEPRQQPPVMVPTPGLLLPGADGSRVGTTDSAVGVPGPSSPGNDTSPISPTSSTSLTQPAAGAPAAASAGHVHASGGLRRNLTEVEAAAKTDFNAIDAAWQSALDMLEADFGPITADQKNQIVEQVRKLADAGDMTGLAAMQVDSSAAAETILAAMELAAEDALRGCLKEGIDQGVRATADPKIDSEKMLSVSETIAALAAGGLVAYAARVALQNWATGTDSVVNAVRTGIDGLTGSSLRDNLGAALSAAQNTGREAAFVAMPQANYYASEVLDTNTCPACQTVDGQPYADWSAAQEAYATGGYVGCLGGLRCRGIVVAVWQ